MEAARTIVDLHRTKVVAPAVPGGLQVRFLPALR